MAAEPQNLLNFYDQDAVNFQKNDTAADSDMDEDDDQLHSQKTKEEVLKVPKTILKALDKHSNMLLGSVCASVC